MTKTTVKRHTFTLVGMSYRVTNPTRQELVKHLPFTVRVEREPDNPHDENAIAVSIDQKDVPTNPMKIGYLRRQVAEVLAPAFDNKTVSVGKAKLVAIDVDEGTGQIELWLKMASVKGKFTLDKDLKL